MRRREFFGGMAALTAANAAAQTCDCLLLAQNRNPQSAPQPPPFSPPPDPWQNYAHTRSKLRVTGMKAIGVSWEKASDRPYVFVKLETNAGVVGWGEATLEGKAGAVLACVDDFREHILGSDPMQVEHLWQSMYVHRFYRAVSLMGSAISGIDQALWDIRGKVLGLPVYKLLGGPFDPHGVRGYYHANARTREQLARLRETAVKDGVTCFKTGP